MAHFLMKSYLDFINEQALNEDLITFGGKAYPRFGQVVVLAGGGGSGKGFSQKNVLGIEGKVLDVDALKELAMKSKTIIDRIKKETGEDISKFNLRKPENTSRLHTLIDDHLNLVDRRQRPLFKSVMTQPENRKPNIIFDVTLKSMTKIGRIADNIQRLGYQSDNVHIVWVIQQIEVAQRQNRSRERVVADDIVLATHKGAGSTMKSLVSDANRVRKYADGDIWFLFNKPGIDSKKVVSDRGGSYFKNIEYVQVKKQGKPVDYDRLTDKVVEKIRKYVPNPDTWEKD